MVTKDVQNFQRCQINTPHDVVFQYWALVKKYRERLGSVLDMGAGDGRFACGGHYDSYEGVEIDVSCMPISTLPVNASISHKCVFEHLGSNYSACIGNPPYVRHHLVEKEWRDKIIVQIKEELGLTLNEQCNLFLYFICLGIIKTEPTGLVALVIPCEWASRPSAKPLHKYLKQQRWAVDIYKFEEEIFKGVLTTASITIIDKASTSSKWTYYTIDKRFKIKKRKGLSENSSYVLPYEGRGNIWALRGLSPGTQKVFTLTEGERIHFGLGLNDVEPCVTSLRGVPASCKVLNAETFNEHFRKKDNKCWLIKSHLPWDELSLELKEYINHIPEDKRNTSTCTNRAHWYKYQPHPTPLILYGSGFTAYGPKFILNHIGAKSIGSVHGIHSGGDVNELVLLSFLNSTDFEKDIVAHSGSLKKVEVKQMNGVLNRFSPSKDS